MTMGTGNLFRNNALVVRVNVYLVMGFFLLLLGVYGLRLYYLQVIRGEYYRDLAENNRIRIESISAPRGIIRDRNGVVLVDSRPAYHVYLVREKNPVNEIVRKLSELCEVPEGNIKAILDKYSKLPAFQPIKIMSDISRDCLAKIEANGHRIPGIYVEIEPVRNYRFPGIASHVLGYLGEITEDDLNKPGYAGYKMGDDIGKSGIEKTFERVLRGSKGTREVEVDALGRRIRVVNEKDPIAGQGIWLTIDARLQSKAEELMKSLEGAVVAVDVRTGAIRALYSSPSFDENVFVKGISLDTWKSLNTDPRHPLLNRAIQSAYPPGSTIKPFVALAGLQEGFIGKDDRVVCRGFFSFGDRNYRCWKKGGHGSVELYRAIVESCDVYFYQLGSRLGITKLSQYLRMFGFGKPTGIELVGEKGGIVPDSDWKMKVFRQPWFKGETIPVSIGQGYLIVTPLQLVLGYAAIANEGTLNKPYLVERIEGSKERVDLSKFKKTIPIKPEYFKLVKQGLEGVVKDQRGTAHRIWRPDCPIAGKTGTAQVVRLTERVENEEKIPKQFRDHAWFVGYAPSDNPEIAVAVIVEHGGHGGATAAPLVLGIIEEYFLKTENQQ